MNDSPYLPVRLASKEDGESIYRMLLDARDAIGITPEFVQTRYLDWVISQCSTGNAWVIDTDRPAIAAMIMDKAELAYLVVAKGFRTKGLCQQLLKHAKSLCPSITVEAKQDNHQMIKRLTDNGFVRFERQKTPGMISFCWNPV